MTINSNSNNSNNSNNSGEPMKFKLYQSLSDGGKEIEIPENSTFEQVKEILAEKKLRHVGVGELAWDNTDDRVGYRKSGESYNSETHAYIRALVDTFFWQKYSIDTTTFPGMVYHPYNGVKQGGISLAAGVVWDPNKEMWGQVNWVANKPQIKFVRVQNTPKAGGGWLKETVAMIPEAQALRHTLVDYFLGEDFKGIRINAAPWSYPYLAAYITQQAMDDMEEARIDRDGRIQNAQDANKVRQAVGQALRSDTVDETIRVIEESLVFEVADGGTVNVHELEPGSYILVHKATGREVTYPKLTLPLTTGGQKLAADGYKKVYSIRL